MNRRETARTLTNVIRYYWPAYTGGQTSNGRWRLSSSDVCNTPRRNVTHQGAARGGPVVLRPVRATPCFTKWSNNFNEGPHHMQYCY